MKTNNIEFNYFKQYTQQQQQQNIQITKKHTESNLRFFFDLKI